MRPGPCAHIPTPEAPSPPVGPAFGKAWRALAKSGQTHCPYCRCKFAVGCPPTFDHKIPKANGGTLEDGFVMACQSCNSARGDTPYEEYMAAVEEEWRSAKLVGRGYKRPKRVHSPDGNAVVLALSKKERQQLWKTPREV